MKHNNFKAGSKLGLKEQFADTAMAQVFSRKRLDEEELYRVMGKLHMTRSRTR